MCGDVGFRTWFQRMCCVSYTIFLLSPFLPITTFYSDVSDISDIPPTLPSYDSCSHLSLLLFHLLLIFCFYVSPSPIITSEPHLRYYPFYISLTILSSPFFYYFCFQDRIIFRLQNNFLYPRMITPNMYITNCSLCT